MIRHTGSGYQVLSESGKHLGGPYKTRKEAQDRLAQVEWFKHHPDKNQASMVYYGASDEEDLFNRLGEVHQQVKHLLPNENDVTVEFGHGHIYTVPHREGTMGNGPNMRIVHGNRGLTVDWRKGNQPYRWTPKAGWFLPGIYGKRNRPVREANIPPEYKDAVRMHVQKMLNTLMPLEQDWRPDEMLPEDHYTYRGQKHQYATRPPIPPSRPCPGCGQVAPFDDRLGDMDFFRCRSCGLLFNQVRKSEPEQKKVPPLDSEV